MQTENGLWFDAYYLAGPHGPLVWQGQAVQMPPKALAVLWVLAIRAGRVVTKEELLTTVWADMTASEETLTAFIGILRRALKDDSRQPRYIATVHRVGYRFIAPLHPSPSVLGPQLSVISQNKQVSIPSQLTTSFVGRDAELGYLYSLFTKVLNGERQIVFVTGEAGIGKTALVEVFVQSLASRVERQEPARQRAKSRERGAKIHSSSLALSPLLSAPCVAWGQCIEQYGAGEAYLPVLEALGRLGRGPQKERLLSILQQYAPTWLAQLPALLSPTEREAVQRHVQGGTRERMLREITEALEVLSAEQPLVLVLEDMHWSDPSTVEFLAALARRREAAYLLVLVTYRPVELMVTNHPLKAAKQGLIARGQGTEILLGGLSREAVRSYVTHRLGAVAQQDEVVKLVHQRTEGHPLFMVQITDYLAQQDMAQTLPQEVRQQIPDGLQQLIEMQLGYVGEDARQVLAVASVVGHEFTVASVMAGMPETHQDIETTCEYLSHQGHFIDDHGSLKWPDGTVSERYRFRHALYQEVLYTRLPEARRVRLHHTIGERIERGYGEHANEVAAELAMHFERGHDFQRAVLYLKAAADTALRRHAYAEAIGLLRHALKVLEAWPDTSARVQQELALHVALGTPLLLTKGQASPEVERTYNRARELCQHIGDTPQLFHVLLGLWRFYSNRAQYQVANEVADQFLTRAQHTGDTVRLSHAHAMQAQTWLLLGDFVQAKSHAEQGLTLYEPQQHRSQLALYGIDAKIFCLSHASHALWLLGYPDQALRCSQDMLAWSRELGHAFNSTLAFERAATCHFLRREAESVQEQAQAGITLAHKHGFAAREAYDNLLYGWVLVQRDQYEEGITLIRESITAFQATGAELLQTYFLAILAEAYGKGGRPEEGLQVIAQALTLVSKTEERLYEAELWRIAGELSLRTGEQANRRQGKEEKEVVDSHTHPLAHSSPEDCFQKATAIARQQHAKSLELRAVMSLMRLWQQRSPHATRHTQYESRTKLAEAHIMLSELYHWFTEGFDTKDLQETKVLLETLSG